MRWVGLMPLYGTFQGAMHVAEINVRQIIGGTTAAAATATVAATAAPVVRAARCFCSICSSTALGGIPATRARRRLLVDTFLQG